MKICIFSLYKSENLGEMVYTECLKKMLEQNIPGVDVQLVDIHGRDATQHRPNGIILRGLKKLGASSLEKKLRFAKENDFLRNYYSERVRGAKAVIIPGGGYIKCTPKSANDRSYRYNEYFAIMADVCEENNIGLYYNAVGHTINRNEENEIKAWKKTFSMPAVQYVSCRDELDFFKKVYKDTRLVCCTAAYSATLYGFERDKHSNTIGIGVIRQDAFEDYGYKVSREDLIRFYIDLIHELEDRGHCVKLFTNGLTRDYEFGRTIAEKYGNRDLLVNRPVTVEELLGTISSFKGVIVSRMHAAIIAYSFDIPAVCLCWNNKHLGFMRSAGVPERAIYPENFKALQVADIMESALLTGWPEEQKETYRTTALSSVDEIIARIRA